MDESKVEGQTEGEKRAVCVTYERYGDGDEFRKNLLAVSDAACEQSPCGPVPGKAGNGKKGGFDGFLAPREAGKK